MRDTPGDVTSTIVCPACEAETIEHQLFAEDESEYRCLRCGATFNAGGGEPPLADSDALHVP